MTSVNNSIFNFLDLGAKEYIWVPMVDGSGVGSMSGTSTNRFHTWTSHCCLTSVLAELSGVTRSDWELSYLDKFRADVD